MIPIVFEAPTGAAGKAMLHLMQSVKNHHRAYVFPFDDRHETAVFQTNWMHRISTSVQLGTANMIHQIPLGNRAYARISKEDYGERLRKIEREGDPAETDGESEDGARRELEPHGEQDNEREMSGDEESYSLSPKRRGTEEQTSDDCILPREKTTHTSIVTNIDNITEYRGGGLQPNHGCVGCNIGQVLCGRVVYVCYIPWYTYYRRYTYKNKCKRVRNMHTCEEGLRGTR